MAERFRVVWVRSPAGPWWCVVDTAQLAPDGGELVVADGGLGPEGCSLARNKARWLEAKSTAQSEPEEDTHAEDDTDRTVSPT